MRALLRARWVILQALGAGLVALGMWLVNPALGWIALGLSVFVGAVVAEINATARGGDHGHRESVPE